MAMMAGASQAKTLAGIMDQILQRAMLSVVESTFETTQHSGPKMDLC